MYKINKCIMYKIKLSIKKDIHIYFIDIIKIRKLILVYQINDAKLYIFIVTNVNKIIMLYYIN